MKNFGYLVAIAALPALADDPILYFRTTDYATMMCDTAKLAKTANFVSHGLAITTDPNYDAEWLQKQIGDKKCKQLAPSLRFMATPAQAVYAGSYGVEWVTGVISPQAPNGSPVGYVPIQYTEFIPIPTL